MPSFHFQNFRFSYGLKIARRRYSINSKARQFLVQDQTPKARIQSSIVRLSVGKKATESESLSQRESKRSILASSKNKVDSMKISNQDSQLAINEFLDLSLKQTESSRNSVPEATFFSGQRLIDNNDSRTDFSSDFHGKKKLTNAKSLQTLVQEGHAQELVKIVNTWASESESNQLVRSSSEQPYTVNDILDAVDCLMEQSKMSKSLIPRSKVQNSET